MRPKTNNIDYFILGKNLKLPNFSMLILLKMTWDIIYYYFDIPRFHSLQVTSVSVDSIKKNYVLNIFSEL